MHDCVILKIPLIVVFLIFRMLLYDDMFYRDLKFLNDWPCGTIFKHIYWIKSKRFNWDRPTEALLKRWSSIAANVTAQCEVREAVKDLKAGQSISSPQNLSRISAKA